MAYGLETLKPRTAKPNFGRGSSVETLSTPPSVLPPIALKKKPVEIHIGGVLPVYGPKISYPAHTPIHHMT